MYFLKYLCTDSQRDFTNALRTKLRQLCPDMELQNISYYEKRFPEEIVNIKSRPLKTHI